MGRLLPVLSLTMLIAFGGASAAPASTVTLPTRSPAKAKTKAKTKVKAKVKVTTKAPAAPLLVPRTPAQCAAALDCDHDEINLMTMQQRSEFVDAMQKGPGAKFGGQSRWQNIRGVIWFFRDHRWGPPNTWVSWVDAGIVEGIEGGLAIASGNPNGGMGNPGSQLWADYVVGLKAGYPSRASHDRAWGRAEQASTDWGSHLAVDVHNLPPSVVEKNFLDFSQLYRSILMNKQEAVNVVRLYGELSGQPEVTFASRDFVEWLTDVGNINASRQGCELSYLLSSGYLFDGVGQFFHLLSLAIPDLLNQYFADQRSKGAVAAQAPSRKRRPAVTITPDQLRRVAPHLAAELAAPR